jgi:hypothetical protein
VRIIKILPITCAHVHRLVLSILPRSKFVDQHRFSRRTRLRQPANTQNPFRGIILLTLTPCRVQLYDPPGHTFVNSVRSDSPKRVSPSIFPLKIIKLTETTATHLSSRKFHPIPTCRHHHLRLHFFFPIDRFIEFHYSFMSRLPWNLLTITVVYGAVKRPNRLSLPDLLIHHKFHPGGKLVGCDMCHVSNFRKQKKKVMYAVLGSNHKIIIIVIIIIILILKIALSWFLQLLSFIIVTIYYYSYVLTHRTPRHSGRINLSFRILLPRNL